VAAMRIILHGKAAGDSRVRTAVHAVRQNGHPAEVRVTWEPGDASRLTAEAVADAGAGKVNCIVAGGGDGTINEVFATAYGSGLPAQCSLGILPLGTGNRRAGAGSDRGPTTCRRQLAAMDRYGAFSMTGRS
jgi:diacylglycerol kinase family enzyme